MTAEEETAGRGYGMLCCTAGLWARGEEHFAFNPGGFFFL